MVSSTPKNGQAMSKSAALLCGAVLPSTAGGTSSSLTDNPNGSNSGERKKRQHSAHIRIVQIIPLYVPDLAPPQLNLEAS